MAQSARGHNFIRGNVSEMPVEIGNERYPRINVVGNSLIGSATRSNRRVEEFKVLGEDCQVVVRTASGGNYVKVRLDIGNRSSLSREGSIARSLETLHALVSFHSLS